MSIGMQAIHILELGAQDASSLSPLATQAFVAAWAPIIGLEYASAYAAAHLTAAALRLAIEAKPGEFFQARSSDLRLLGYARIDHQAQAPAGVAAVLRAPLLLQRLYLDPQAYGQGAATALHDRAMQLAQADGYDGLWLVTDPRNARAWAFYQKLGYTDTAAFPYEYAPGQFNERCRALVLKLG